MAPFKDEHLLIIAPGSQTTLAQVGLPEAFTPPRVRIKSRMFPTDEPGRYEPYRIRSRPRQAPKANGAPATADETDQQPKMEGVTPADTDVRVTEPTGDAQEDDSTLEEDPISDAGAVWPIREGRIVDWPAFFALMQHLHNMLGGGFHTPIMLIAQPAWTPVEHIRITRFFFEKFKCPAFALMDAAQAMCYAYGVHTACVVDIGRDKADVTAINEFSTSHVGRGIAIPGVGGEAMTQHLLSQMEGDGWTREMAEQLKMNPICEILPPDMPIPGSKDASQAQQQAAKAKEKPQNPAAAASTGADGPGAQQRDTAGAAGTAPRGPGQDAEGRPAEVGEEDTEEVLDVASIVAGGKTSEYLAKKEKEKQEKAAAAAAKKSKTEANAAQAKAVRLRNSEREYNSFVFDDKAAREQAKDDAAASGVNGHADPSSTVPEPVAAVPPPPAAVAAPAQPPAIDTAVVETGAAAEVSLATVPSPTTSTAAPEQTSPTTPAARDAPRLPPNPYTRNVTVGPARFAPLPEAYMPTLTTAIHTAIQAVPASHVRQMLWVHILVTGQGSRTRGLRELILHALAARFLVSPSSASIFTSEPPSSFGTPGGTGTNTPLPSGQSSLPPFTPGSAGAPPGSLAGGAPQPSAVNPLLYAATTGGNAPPPALPPGQLGLRPQNAGMSTPARMTPQPPGGQFRGGTPGGTPGPAAAPSFAARGPGGHTGGTSQTPTAVRPGRLPEYFGEWKEAGAEAGAAFLGAQVAAKVIFLADVQGGSSKGFMSRSDYNEQGPSAIADYSL